MIVLDASVAVAILLPTQDGSRFRDRVLREKLHAPHLIDVEFANALRRMIRTGGVDTGAALRAIETMQTWRLQRHDHWDLLPRIWELRDSVSAYDASYIALAEGLRAPMMTCDGKLARAHGHSARIVLLT